MYPTIVALMPRVLWTLNFASQLVLLVVLLGRERLRTWPWFTASIIVFSIRLLAEMLLTGRMAMLPLQAVFIGLADIAAVVGLLVVVEVAWRTFHAASRRAWTIGLGLTLTIAALVLWQWGPWQDVHQLTFASPIMTLRTLQFFAQKLDLFRDVLTVCLSLLVVIFGGRFGAGWRSHAQMLAIGLGTVAAGWLSIQAAWQMIMHQMQPTTREEYMHLLDLGTRLTNTNKIIYIVVVLWWIVWLWRDEVGDAAGIASDEQATLASEPAE